MVEQRPEGNMGARLLCPWLLLCRSEKPHLEIAKVLKSPSLC